MQLYVDLIWLLNLLFDWTILLLVAWLTKTVYSRWRVFFGALFASLIIPLSISFGMEWLYHPIAKLLYSIGIILIAFPFQRLKKTTIQFLSFYFVNFAIGGGIYGLDQFFNASSGLSQLPNAYGNIFSWMVVVILFPIVFYLTKDQLQRLAIQRTNEQQVYPVSLKKNNQTIEATGFYDSGNQLKHPISKKPVILIDEKTANRLLGVKKTEIILQSHQLSSKELAKNDIQLIPYTAAGGGQSDMPAILIDHITVHDEEVIVVTKHIYVGVQPGELSKNTAFQVLLHPAVFQSKSTRLFHSEGVSS